MMNTAVVWHMHDIVVITHAVLPVKELMPHSIAPNLSQNKECAPAYADDHKHLGSMR
jgi:hypothetical protein